MFKQNDTPSLVFVFLEGFKAICVWNAFESYM